VAIVKHVSAVDGATDAGVNAVLPAAGAIKGTVTSAAGNPLGGICVVAPGAPGGAEANIAETRPDGMYDLPGLPSGNWKIEFQPDCGIYGTWTESATQAHVSTGTTTNGVDGILAPGGSIVGQVTDSDFHGLSRMCVLAVPLSSHQPAELATTSAGAYSLVALAPGRYDVGFTNGCGNPTTYETQWWKGAATQAGATAVVVTSGQTTVDIHARLRPAT
jgi:hypothetical protein